MKVTVTLLLILVCFLAGHAHGEYRVKVHPPIPPPPLPPIIKLSSSPLKGGHRWSSNSLGPPRLHHHHLHHRPPSVVHHHLSHGPPVHHHSGPSPPKSIIRPLHIPHHHHVHAPLSQAAFSAIPLPHSSHSHSSHAHSSHIHPSPPHPPSLVLHHHHHHVPPTGALRPSFKAPWKGPQGGSIGSSFGPSKDTFHPSPPDGAQAIVATHQTVDDNKGPIHTIPAPNLGPSGKHPNPRPVITLGSYSGSGQGSGFQTGHGIGQGSGDAGGPYPNPVYGKPVMVNLTYHEPMATPEAQSQTNSNIPTITIQSSHGYQVHEQGIGTFVTPATPVVTQVTTVSPSGALFAPDPDPSLPAPKVPYTLDPHSHPSNGQSPPDLVQEIPQHLLTLYGFNQQGQNVHLQPQTHVQEQHQVHPQLSSVAVQSEVVHQGGQIPTDYGGQLILSQALAQFEAQSQPETYSQVGFQQQHLPQQQVQVIHDSGVAHQAQFAPEYFQNFEQVSNPPSVSVQPVPLVASTHETVYQTVNSPQVVGLSDGKGTQYSAFDLFANSPVNSPVLDSLKEHFQQYSTSTPAPPTSTVGNSHFQYQLPVSTTVAPPTSTPVTNAIYGHQQQHFISTTAAPTPLPVVNNIEYQPQQIHDFSQNAVTNGQSFSDLYHNLGAIALEGHQAQSVSVSNPGQAGYIAATYHTQQSGNAAVPQVQTHIYNFGQDSFSAETRHKTSSVKASDVNSLANSLPTGIGSGALRNGGAETVRPSSSSSFYSEKAVRAGSQDSTKETVSKQEEEAEEDPEYYDEEVAQEVDSDDDRQSENPQPALPSGYGIYESYESNGQSSQKENNEQEYEDNDSQYEDYPTQAKKNQNDQANLDEEKALTRQPPIRNYNHNIEYGTRLRPKKNN